MRGKVFSVRFVAILVGFFSLTFIVRKIKFRNDSNEIYERKRPLGLEDVGGDGGTLHSSVCGEIFIAQHYDARSELQPPHQRERGFRLQLNLRGDA